MASEAPFRELLQYAVGGGWGQEKPFPDSEAVRVIRGTDFANIASGRYDAIPRRFESRSKAERRFLRPNDIVLEVSGGSRTSNQSTGRTLLVTADILDRLGPAIPASFCRLVRVDETAVLPRYAFYALQEMYRSGRAGLYEHHSTGISNFQFQFFLDQEVVWLPPLPEQRAITHILGTLDDRIELNRRMNETLEAVARALFKSWFVDFDPVRAKADGRDSGLPDEIADLFPEEIADHPNLGEMPEGWKAATLSTFAELNPEGWSRSTAPETVRYIDLANTKWGSITSIAEYPWEEAPSRARRVLRPWDTIVGIVRPGNGSYALVMEQGLTGSTGFAVLRPREPRYRSLVYSAATSRDNIDRLSHLADGAAYPAVRPDVVTATRIVTAPDPVLDLFAHAVDPLLAKIATAEQESRTLAALRDALLPKLISGDLRFDDPERILGRAG